MKTKLLPVLVLLGANLFAQQDIYALTGKKGPNIVFNDFRALSSAGSDVIFSMDSTPIVYSEARKMTVKEEKSSYHNAQAAAIAALAYDKTDDNLVYMPMFSSNIYVLNSKTKNITLVENTVVKTTACDLGSHFTRMTLGYDGNIYALNNSGSQLIKISKQNGRYQVEDLGSIADDASNGTNTIKAVNTGYGGDLIADADNNLYIFSASGNVFKFSTAKKSALFLGKIEGLPSEFTLNGAAVNEKGEVVLASAKGGEMYAVTLDNLHANVVSGSFSDEAVYDLASSHFLNERVISQAGNEIKADVYPTQIDQKYFNVKLNPEVKTASVEIFDISGTRVLKTKVKNEGRRTDSRVELNQMKSGVYIVNILDADKNILVSKKILVTK